jgi:uroporphyrinogen-III synthase
LAGINALTVEFMQCDSCLIYLVDGEELVLCSSNAEDADRVVGNVRLKVGEGLTGWVAKNRRMLAIPREAYADSRFKYFAALPEDTYEAFLSAPIIARNRVVGVVNVQHRARHQHSGGEMEMITTIGEQIGALLVLARMSPDVMQKAHHIDLVFPAKVAR